MLKNIKENSEKSMPFNILNSLYSLIQPDMP